jgi:hypothetical protein
LVVLLIHIMPPVANSLAQFVLLLLPPEQSRSVMFPEAAMSRHCDVVLAVAVIWSR